MAQQGFGRRYKPDERDKQYQITTPKKKSKRTYRYWYDSALFGDQGRTPHCVGFSWMHWLANAPVISWINPDGIYKLAQHFDEWKGTNYDGTSVRAGAKILRWLGLIEKYQWCWDVDTLIETVLEKGPVVVGTNWHQAMSIPNDEGLIEVKGRVVGGHAYLVTGVSTTKGLFRLKNSWGKKWGDEGRALISIEDMGKLIKAEGEVCLAVERLAKPPRQSRPSIQKEPEQEKERKPRQKKRRPGVKPKRPWQQIVE